MTREAKIGLLTGLIVIVLIGVLLSEYLGGPAAGATAESNRMAVLPMGATYREHIMKPITVPGMERTESASGNGAGPAQFPAPAPAPLVDPSGSLPTAFAHSNGGPVVDSPVTPVNDGRIVSRSGSDSSGDVPIIQVMDQHSGSTTTGVAVSGISGIAQAAMSGEQYVIAPGDTLSKIAKKHFGSAKPEDIQRIVAANPGTLKSATTMLIAGHKLLIPRLNESSGSVKPLVGSAGSNIPRPTVVIRTPGSKPTTVVADQLPGDAAAVGHAVQLAAPKTSGQTYSIQSGDTLEKIARKLSPHNPQAYAKKLAAMNKIKDPRGLKIGVKLQLP